MKKIKFFMTMMAIALVSFSFTSCEDEEIARDLEGTWEGNIHVSSKYDGVYYYSTKTYVCFDRDIYKYAAGEGYWVDYYDSYKWSWGDYVANHITWRVDNGVIKIHFVDDGDNVKIYDYSLNDRYFSGIVETDDFQKVSFRLTKTSSFDWKHYDHWGYAKKGIFDGQTRGTSTATKRPQRVFHVKE